MAAGSRWVRVMDNEFIHQADMGFTRAELLKGLKTAVEPYQIRDLDAEVIEITAAGRTVKLSTGPDGFRTIASMRVPMLPVKLEFSGFNAEQYRQFMLRFKRYLHKGGG